MNNFKLLPKASVVMILAKNSFPQLTLLLIFMVLVCGPLTAHAESCEGGLAGEISISDFISEYRAAVVKQLWEKELDEKYLPESKVLRGHFVADPKASVDGRLREGREYLVLLSPQASERPSLNDIAVFDRETRQVVDYRDLADEGEIVLSDGRRFGASRDNDPDEEEPFFWHWQYPYAAMARIQYPELTPLLELNLREFVRNHERAVAYNVGSGIYMTPEVVSNSSIVRAVRSGGKSYDLLIAKNKKREPRIGVSIWFFSEEWKESDVHPDEGNYYLDDGRILKIGFDGDNQYVLQWMNKGKMSRFK